jgi:hypothetical protein
MTDHEIDALVTAANPIDERELGALPLGHVELALREAVLRSGRRRPAAWTRPARRLPSRRLLTGLAVAALVACGLVVLTARDPGQSGTAWAAPLVRLAESSPLLLLDRPGWSVTRADETDEVEGEMTFAHGSSHSADLHWRRGSLEDWQRDRAKSGSQVVHRTVLGQRAQLSQYAGSTDFTAIWPDGSRVLEFRAVTVDLAAFEQLLGSLKRVDVDTWLSAMPASVVKSANRAAVVAEMLSDIPAPPGFDPASLEIKPTVSDRYQLGAQVTGAVACAWIARWDAARKRGDIAAAQAAVDAMQTSHHWKALDQMQKDGAWPEVLRSYADAMRGDGRGLKGDSLLAEVRSGLGCGGG